MEKMDICLGRKENNPQFITRKAFCDKYTDSGFNV